MCFIRLFVKLVAWHDGPFFLFGATRGNHTRKVRSQCQVAKLLACFTSPLADDLPFSPFFGMERFCPPPDSLKSAIRDHHGCANLLSTWIWQMQRKSLAHYAMLGRLTPAL